MSQHKVVEFVFKDDGQDPLEILEMSDLYLAPSKLDDAKDEVRDPLKEILLHFAKGNRPLFISKRLPEDFKRDLVELLTEFQDCFAWDYDEMPGLDRSLIEHRLSIRPGFWPYQQPIRRMMPEVAEKVKVEIDRLLDAGFIRKANYVE